MSEPFFFPKGRSSGYALCLMSILPRLREIAREKGYALAVHGSMERDFDLLACPWTEEASSADELAEALRDEYHGHYGVTHGKPRDENPESKPHGRKAYSWYYYTFDETSLGPYVDLSVMPREQDR